MVKNAAGTEKSEKKGDLIYVIFGKEPGIVSLEVENLVSRLLEPDEKTCLYRCESSKAVAGEIFDELRTLPFLARRRVVIVRDADKFISDNRQLLEDYFDSPCPTGVLVLTVESWRNDTKLAKKLSRVGRLIAVKSPTEAELPMRIIKYAQDAHKKKVSRQAAELVIELTGEDLAVLYGQVDKLALFAEGKDYIDLSDIEQLIGRNRLFNAFEVIDGCLVGDIGKAVSRLRDMFDKDKDTEYTVIGAFAYHFRRIFAAKVLLDKGVSPYQAAKQIGVWFNTDGFFSQAKRLSLRQVGGFLEELAELDYAAKTGRADVKTAMENLVLRLSS